MCIADFSGFSMFVMMIVECIFYLEIVIAFAVSCLLLFRTGVFHFVRRIFFCKRDNRFKCQIRKLT